MASAGVKDNRVEPFGLPKRNEMEPQLP